MPLALGVLGLGAALAVCLGPLAGIPHVQDDVAYLWQAKIFALGRAWVPAPPFKEFFDAGFVLITDGRWFTKYPPGWPLLLAPGVGAGLPWLVNPLCAGLSLALIYATGRRLYGRAAAFWAAALGLSSPFLLFMSGSFMSHPSTMLATAAALYCFVRVKQVGSGQWTVDGDEGPVGQSSALDEGTKTSPGPEHSKLKTQNSKFSHAGWALGVGGALGWAFISREATAVGVALPFVIWGVVDGLGALVAGARAPRGTGARRRVLLQLAPYGLMVLGALPPLLVLGVVNQALLGSPFALAQALVGPYDRLGFGPGFGPEEGGHTPALGLYNALVYLRTLEDQLFGWPALLALGPLLLALAATPWRAWRAARWDLFLLGGFLGLAGIYFAWWSATTIFGPRYWYESLPFLLLLSGRGVALLGSAATAMAGHRTLAAPSPPGPVSRLAGPVVSAVLVGILALFDLAQVLPGQVRVYTGYDDVDVSSLRRVAAAHLDHALVFVALQPAFPRRDYGKVFFANDPLLRGPVVYARDVDPIHNRALVQSFPGRHPYYLPLTGPPHPGVGP